MVEKKMTTRGVQEKSRNHSLDFMGLDKSIRWKNLTQWFCCSTSLINVPPNFEITDFKFCVILLYVNFFLRAVIFIPYKVNGNAIVLGNVSQVLKLTLFYSLPGIMFYVCCRQIYQQIRCTFWIAFVDNAKVI